MSDGIKFFLFKGIYILFPKESHTKIGKHFLPKLNSTLAISASYVDFCQRKPSVSPKTLHHIAKAYELVNVKLSGPNSVSDSAIAAVVALTMYQQVHNQHSAGLVHLHGLFQMIRLRGGIFRLLRENRALALKALRCVLKLAAVVYCSLFLRN